VTTTTFKIVLSFLLINCLYAYGQLSYYDNGVTYRVGQNKRTLFTQVVFDSQRSSSRSLNLAVSQSRLKSTELMGLYLLFKDAYPAEQQNDDIFSLFVQYYGSEFKADVSDVQTRRTGPPENQILEFSCPVSKYQLVETPPQPSPSAEELSREHYYRERSLNAAELYVRYGNVPPSDFLKIISGMLSRAYAPIPVLSKSFLYHPGAIFETSLVVPEDISLHLPAELKAEMEVAEPFAKRLLLMNLITIAPGQDEKNIAYQEYLSLLKPDDNLWDHIVLFAAECTEQLDEAADLFHAMLSYPGALNMHLFSGMNGDYYNEAVNHFNNNQPDSALHCLEESINFNGVTREKTGLTAAIFRLQEDYKNCLAISTLNAFYGLETDYLPGNLYLSLKALGYSNTEKLKKHLLNDMNCDAWSSDILKNNER
jgi:hypothetical protein